MYVCSCRGVTDRSIRNAITSGAGTVEEIGQVCGAGTRCGGCWPVLDELIDRVSTTRRPEPAA